MPKKKQDDKTDAILTLFRIALQVCIPALRTPTVPTTVTNHHALQDAITQATAELNDAFFKAAMQDATANLKAVFEKWTTIACAAWTLTQSSSLFKSPEEKYGALSQLEDYLKGPLSDAARELLQQAFGTSVFSTTNATQFCNALHQWIKAQKIPVANAALAVAI